MGRLKSVEVEVECDDLHCDEATVETCEFLNNADHLHEAAQEALRDVIQQAFREVGPERDRYTDWTRCDEEPWTTLARMMTVVR